MEMFLCRPSVGESHLWLQTLRTRRVDSFVSHIPLRFEGEYVLFSVLAASPASQIPLT